MLGVLLAKVRGHLIKGVESFQSVRKIGFVTAHSFEPAGETSRIDILSRHEFPQEVIVVAKYVTTSTRTLTRARSAFAMESDKITLMAHAVHDPGHCLIVSRESRFKLEHKSVLDQAAYDYGRISQVCLRIVESLRLRYDTGAYFTQTERGSIDCPKI